MFGAYPESFEREMGCTEAEWLMWLPAAMGAVAWRREDSGAKADLAPGQLAIDWRVGEPRVIALVRLPRLHVRFCFDGVDTAARHAFMKRFDLYMQRGGG